jgi:hypothetical protein
MTIKEKQQYARQLAASITPETPPERVREIEEEHAGLIAEIASHASSSHDLLSGHLRTYGVDPRNYDHLPPIARNAAMLDALADVSNRAGPVQGVVNLDPMTGLSRSESRRDNALGEALYVRLNPSHRPSEAARQFVGLTITELARRSLNLAGHYSAGLSAAEAVTRGLHTTSDFPLILGDAVGRVLRAAYATAPSAIVSVARQSSAPDFRARRSLQLSSGPGLEKVSEAANSNGGRSRKAARPTSSKPSAACSPFRARRWSMTTSAPSPLFHNAWRRRRLRFRRRALPIWSTRIRRWRMANPSSTPITKT